ncbi:hypothetical protein HNP46_002183 [Pseudomonas nitritireducens]|uniref:Uncharacterized protein n=1 Tax=Pseudomonas nitroreducens TaxID=46680 RepID=A0A7W7KIF2_PSENT|nr:hypothetical protein [Pseudomonas nitritireducens]MBB4863336.1 hypothetical protein [Pseudomonas nitritireducens]
MNSVFVALDALLCILVVAAALDYLRAVHLLDHPLLCVAFYLVALGAFGILTELARGYWVSPSSVLLHLGVVLYAWSRRSQIFREDWGWNGVERRKVRRP